MTKKICYLENQPDPEYKIYYEVNELGGRDYYKETDDVDVFLITSLHCDTWDMIAIMKNERVFYEAQDNKVPEKPVRNSTPSTEQVEKELEQFKNKLKRHFLDL